MEIERVIKKLTMIRKKNYITQGDMEIEDGLKSQNISKIECGRVSPSFKSIEKYINALYYNGVSEEEVLEAFKDE